MGSVTTRINLISRGANILSPWNEAGYEYSVLQLNLGNNPNSLLEIVSLINVPNLGRAILYYNYTNCLEKYNPKVYLGAVQSVAYRWNSDRPNGQNWGEKSGSWPHYNKIFIICLKRIIIHKIMI